MDYGACMPDEDNEKDKLSLSWFKSWLGGLDTISNEESKIKKMGDYELHDQFITEVGVQFLTNAFKNFLKTNSDNICVNDKMEAQKLILEFLDQNEIRFFFDPTCTEEKEKFDDLLSYCKDLTGRTVLSLVIDKGSHQYSLKQGGLS